MRYKFELFQERYPLLAACMFFIVASCFGLFVIFVFTHGQQLNTSLVNANEIACIQAYGHYNKKFDRCEVRR